jgi:arylsulfatase A-like enzyme
MKKVMIVSIVLLGAAAVPINAHAAEQQAAAERPNIIFLLSDDQAWTDYGFMGHPEIQTPHLDKLSEESLLFRRGYLAAPVCRPSLASMVTGLHPFDHGVTGNDLSKEAGGRAENRQELDQPVQDGFYQHPGLIETLTDNGYLAHQSGKWWEGSWKDGGFTHGMKMEGRHGSAASLAIGRKGLKPVTDFVDMAVEQEKPFFLWYGVFLPHTPHNPPARLLNKYKKEGRALDVAKYYAMCEWLDETCGELLAYLDQKGALENTLIVYICDNGWAARSTNADDPNQAGIKSYALRSKTSPYENGIRTPVMISWPGKIEPADVPSFAHSIDLFPTLAKAAGVPVPEGLPGIDLLNENARTERKTIFGSVHSSHNISLENLDDTLQYLWCIDGKWKLLVRHDGVDSTWFAKMHNWDTELIRLYDLENDPHEKNDIASDHPEIVTRLHKKLEVWHPVQP